MSTISCLAGQDVDSELEDQFRSGIRQIADTSEQLDLRIKAVSVGTRSSVMFESDHSPEQIAEIKATGIDSVEYKTASEYAVRGDSKLEIGTDDTGVDFVVACNPAYAFSLQRKTGTVNYGLQLLEQRGLDPRVEQTIDRVSALGMRSILSGWTIYDERIDKLVESAEFRITRIAEVAQDGAKLVRIDYQRPVAEVRVGKLSYGDCHMVCDPVKHWGLVEYAVTFVDKDGKALSRNEAHFVLEMVNAVPVPTQFNYTITNTTGEARIVNKGSGTIQIVSSAVPESDFLISSFGLPEPNFNPRLSGRFWSTTILAVVCLIGIWLIRKRRQST